MKNNKLSMSAEEAALTYCVRSAAGPHMAQGEGPRPGTPQCLEGR